MPDFVSSPANFCHLLLYFVGYFDVFPYLPTLDVFDFPSAETYRCILLEPEEVHIQYQNEVLDVPGTGTGAAQHDILGLK